MANTNQVIVNGKTILDLRSDTVTPKTLQKGITAPSPSFVIQLMSVKL